MVTFSKLYKKKKPARNGRFKFLTLDYVTRTQIRGLTKYHDANIQNFIIV